MLWRRVSINSNYNFNSYHSFLNPPPASAPVFTNGTGYMRIGNRFATVTNLTASVTAMFSDEYYQRRWFMLDFYPGFATETVDTIREYLGDEPKSVRTSGTKVREPSDMSSLPSAVRVHFAVSSFFSFQPQPRTKLFEFEVEQVMQRSFKKESACLVCQDDMDGLPAKTSLVFCKICKNFSHENCLITWLTTINEFNASMYRAWPPTLPF
jgi:hypothetical protein